MGAQGFSLNLSRDCKVVHLVRHGQGYHNVATELDPSAYLSEKYLDASLTPAGWEQVETLREHLAESGIREQIDLVVVSPMMRALQTAVGITGEKQPHDENDPLLLPPLMVANAGGSDRAAISSSGCPPFIAIEYCREHLGVRPCDKRQEISLYRTLFPAVDFSEVKSDQDSCWKQDERESEEELYARAKNFITWLQNRTERQILVVSHGSFLWHMLRIFHHNCAAPTQNGHERRLDNCEMKTIVLANRRASDEAIPEDFGGTLSDPDIPPSVTAKSELVENGDNHHFSL